MTTIIGKDIRNHNHKHTRGEDRMNMNDYINTPPTGPAIATVDIYIDNGTPSGLLLRTRVSSKMLSTASNYFMRACSEAIAADLGLHATTETAPKKPIPGLGRPYVLLPATLCKRAIQRWLDWVLFHDPPFPLNYRGGPHFPIHYDYTLTDHARLTQMLRFVEPIAPMNNCAMLLSQYRHFIDWELEYKFHGSLADLKVIWKAGGKDVDEEFTKYAFEGLAREASMGYCEKEFGGCREIVGVIRMVKKRLGLECGHTHAEQKIENCYSLVQWHGCRVWEA
ncbi:hypothetical protein EJ08DRAFT_704303 [Tothia fuscella]|uniref:BTB domain-containing protein n=1 Tax=Tothia fuscella TaxID=1048955 RepID=A0A9P4P232_9PEZI|nr:hypothetical protein EJ08DRAFT_704303 [Tothia fuscella]